MEDGDEDLQERDQNTVEELSKATDVRGVRNSATGIKH